MFPWILLIILVGFSLRVYNLGGSGFWVDEARTGLAARLALPQLLSFSRQTAFEHPPVYFAMLHSWLSIVRESEWNARFFSVIFGTLSIPLAFALYRRLSNNTLAILATLYLALSPFHVVYSKDNRMYAWMGFLAILSTHILLNYLSKRNTRWLVAYALLAFAGVFSHYMFAFFISAQVIYLWVLVLLAKKRQYRKVAGYVTLVAAALSLLLAAWTLQSAGVRDTVTGLISGSALGHRDVLQLTLEKIRKIANDFLLAEKDWSSIPTAIQIFVVSAWILAIWGGLTEAVHPRLVRREGSILFVVLLCVPVVELLLVPQGVVGRYILFAFPAFSFLVVLGVMKVWRKLPWAGLVLAITLTITIGFGHYTTLIAPKDDFNIAASFIGRQIRPGDQVLLTHLFDQPLAEYYINDDSIRIVHYPDNMTPATQNQVERDIPSLLQADGRLWLGPVSSGTLDKEGIIERWLGQYAFQVEKWWFPAGTYTSLYLLPSDDTNEFGDDTITLDEAPQLPRMIGDLLLLRNVRLDKTNALAGSGVRLTLDWKIIGGTSDDLLVSLELRDVEDNLWAKRIGSMQGSTLPGKQWKQGETVIDRHGLWIPEGTPPGTYRLFLRVYNATRDQSVLIGEEESIELATLAVLPGNLPVPAMKMQDDLLEYLRLLGTDKWPDSVEQGTKLPITLYWLPEKPNLPDQDLRLDLVDRNGEVVSSVQGPPSASWYPISLWTEGVAVKGTNTLNIPSRLPAGTYRLVASLSPWKNTLSMEEVSPSWELGRIEVTSQPRELEKPEFQYPTHHTLGGIAELVGYDIQPGANFQPGQSIQLTLYWKAIGESESDFTVFVHLIGPDSQIWGQKDNPPRNSARPTSSWLTGEYIIDEYLVPTSRNAPSGHYAVYLGMYDPASGQRLDAFDSENQRWPNDSIFLHELQVQ